MALTAGDKLGIGHRLDVTIPEVFSIIIASFSVTSRGLGLVLLNQPYPEGAAGLGELEEPPLQLPVPWCGLGAPPVTERIPPSQKGNAKSCHLCQGEKQPLPKLHSNHFNALYQRGYNSV